MKRLVLLLALAACPHPHSRPHPAAAAGSASAAGSAAAAAAGSGSGSGTASGSGSASAPAPAPDSELSLDDVDPSLLGDTGDSSTLEPILDKAQSSLSAHQYDRAISQARAALAIDADDPHALAILARAFIGKEQWDSAQAVLEESCNVAGSHAASAADLWHLLGRASYHLGDSGAALAQLAQAVKLKKDDAGAWNLLGVVHLDRGESAEAVQALETARAHAADSLAIMTNLGSAYRRAAAAAATVEDASELLRKAEQSYTSAVNAGLGIGGGYAPAALGLGLLYLDAPSFPGLDDVTRLERAVKNLADVESMETPGLDKAAIERDYADARRDLEDARRKADRRK